MFWAHSRAEKSEVSRWDHWQQVKKSGGKPKELETMPNLPEECKSVWNAFLRMGQHTSPTEIQAYINLTGHELDPWEVDAILALDKERRNGN